MTWVLIIGLAWLFAAWVTLRRVLARPVVVRAWQRLAPRRAPESTS